MDRLTCRRLLKTDALRHTLDGSWPRYRFNHATGRYALDRDTTPFTASSSARADEEGSRSKECYFSPRAAASSWEVAEQAPEFWNQYKTDFAPGTHVRIHPLLDWTELNIWEHIARERIPITDLYFDHGDGGRYRSLGCAPCTARVVSTAASAEQIVIELKIGQFTHVAERAGYM